jgi:hypothetical protein
MTSRSSKDSEPHTAAFLQGLNEVGYVPEENVRIEYRWADGHYEDRTRDDGAASRRAAYPNSNPFLILLRP